MASYDKTGYDVEYNAHQSTDEKHRSVVVPDESGAVHGESFVAGNTLYARLQRLAGRFGVEQRGIERVPEDERTDKTVIKLSTMVGISAFLKLRELLTMYQKVAGCEYDCFDVRHWSSCSSGVCAGLCGRHSYYLLLQCPGYHPGGILCNIRS